MSKHAQPNLVSGRLPVVSVFGVYDSDDSKRCVETVLAHVAGSLYGAFQLATVLQRCDDLRRTAPGDPVNAKAADADIIIVALEAGAQLRSELLQWLEAWATLRKVADAALAWFTSGTASTPWSTIEGLRLLVERHGLTLLLSRDDVAEHARETKHQRGPQQEWSSPFIAGQAEGIQWWDHSGLNE